MRTARERAKAWARMYIKRDKKTRLLRSFSLVISFYAKEKGVRRDWIEIYKKGLVDKTESK